jgi:pyruvate,water dikinase
MGKKIEIPTEKYIKWLSDLNSKSGSVAGGKGANLAEMYNAKMPVPPAFVVTAQAFDAFIESSGLRDKIQKIIDSTDVDNTAELEKNARKIRNSVVDAKMPEDMQEEISEAYEILGAGEEEPISVAVRSSATTEDLASASFAGQQDTYTNIKGAKELINTVKRCFASLYTARAIYYRHKKGFEKANALLAVVVQKMVNSERSGVIFTKNPVSQKEEIIIEAVFGLGEGIVSGKVMPDQYIISSKMKVASKKIATKKTAIVKDESGKESEIKLDEKKSKQQVLGLGEIQELASIASKIHEHYGKAQDIEFAIEGRKIYIVQSRPITTHKIAKQAGKVHGAVLVTGLGASPGVASGKVKIIKDMADLSKIKEGDILVTKMTNPDMVVTMQKSAAVVTDEGGATAHAAIVSREMGIPAVVGTEEATTKLKDGEIITVDGTNGKVHEGRAEGQVNVKKEVLPVVEGTETKIKVIVDLPDFAERAAKSKAKGVGLLRLEGIIASSGKHPMYFLEKNDTQGYIDLLAKGISEISEHFEEVWIRTSDIRSDEYRNLKGAPKEVELNPMLGYHGIRFSLRHKPILEAELAAIKKVAEDHPDKTFGIMFPQVIDVKEMEEAFKIFREKYHKNNIKIGAMIETPASVQIIRELCKYVQFISFGTNDLTQYTLAVDRGNSDVQYLYNEMHPSVLSQLKKVINTCKEYKVETSICGQAGSKREMAEYLVKLGINSISVNADMAKEISQYIKDLEKSK